MIREEFLNVVDQYVNHPQQSVTYWNEVETRYIAKGRYYHTLRHLDHLLQELVPHKQRIANWHTVVFAIVYHDVVYNTLKSNNEEKSAAFAEERLTSLSYPPAELARCKHLILATKKHAYSDAETNLFTDADLAILGSDPQTYKRYTEQIRAEYKLYPNLVYYPGRRKVLEHFLGMEQVYKTQAFSERYETAARKNLQTELNELQ